MVTRNQTKTNKGHAMDKCCKCGKDLPLGVFRRVLFRASALHGARVICDTCTEDRERQRDIAKTIVEQIKIGDHFAMAAWGARVLTPLCELKMDDGSLQLGGLGFRVTGKKFKGLVWVRLMADDTYRVDFGYNNGGAGVRVVKSLHNVYCDVLMATIDDVVEG